MDDDDEIKNKSDVFKKALQVELTRIPLPDLPLLPISSSTPSNPSSIFGDNQLIHSWIKRYSRENPIEMIGDPDLSGLNKSQLKAVAMCMSERLSLIQGVSLIFTLSSFLDEARVWLLTL